MYVRFARWRDKGVWEQATAWLIRNKRKVPHARQRQVQVDSTSVRVHQHGTGAEKKTANRAWAVAGVATQARFTWWGTAPATCWAGK